ncbi:heat shock 70 kDa protein 12B-like [Hoplias malabaricus]|uniref:heat shock 70 kDa protein 12B-like n=1 Tax=Hoplias malabaricus TaxID=27720 RepID=UPI0034621427
MAQQERKMADLRLQNCKKEIDELRKENLHFRKENGNLKSQNRTLRLENEKIYKEIDALREEYGNLKSEISKLRSEHQSIHSEIPNEREGKLMDNKLESSEDIREPEENIENGKPLKKKHWVKVPFELNTTELNTEQEKKKEEQSDDKKTPEKPPKTTRKQCTSQTGNTYNNRVQRKECIASIGIDFGTAFTGYSFGIKGSKQIRQPKWGEEYGLNTPKTLTCILFDEDENFLKFGYDAIMTYTRQTRKDEAKKQFLFDNFKMELYGRVLHRDSMMTAQNGKKMRAMKVFSESLRFMKDHALEMMGKHTSGKKYSASDVTWVLTVPAIWSAAAKKFMTEAATEAGLVSESNPERLIVALEPEAASVWCKQLPSEGFMEGDLEEAETLEQISGTQYMVVDCGGGTIDVTVHEVAEGGRLKELNRVSGNNMGGQTVDVNFKLFLRETFSEKVFDDFEENHPSEVKRLMYDFSICKRYEGDVLVQCPYNLQELARKVKDMEDYFTEESETDWESGSILLSGSKLKSFHDESLNGIESLIERILENQNLKIKYIFLVGGFALSPYVINFVKEKFGSKYKVLFPVDAAMAVVKGAVMFGMMPNIVESRI